VRVLIRSLIHAAAAVLVLVLPLAGFAADNPNSSQQLGPLVKAAQEKIRAIRSEIEQLDGALNGAANSSAGVMGNVFVGGGRAEYSDLQRTTRDLTDIGNRVLDLTAKCGEEAHQVGVKFRTQTQRLQSDINRIESASGAAMAQMSIGKVRRDVDDTESQLQAVAGLLGSCGS
jgi:hypothetical protein